jgi:hypothetical protein
MSRAMPSGYTLRLSLHIAAVELPVPRGKLKNRINTLLKNPLCRGVDELCTKQLESRCLLFAELKDMKARLHEVQFKEPGALQGDVRAEGGEHEAEEGELQGGHAVVLLYPGKKRR